MAFGLSRQDIPDKEVGIWPDNWDAFKVFEAMSTQWRIGACGATGMDYSVLSGVIRMCGVPISQRESIFGDFRRMEAEALQVMAEQRESARGA
ncbi:DUF1799 domain-containing protein [Pseudomonas poae]|uniref:DUF1799 domain-containing protein n=1 Tax=Pseudomonas poae TaxID=200451 RepID=UPI0030D1A042